MSDIKFVKEGTDDRWEIADPTHEDTKLICSNMWWYSSTFSPKDVPRFFDVSGITENPEAFQKVIDVFVARYKAAGDQGPTHILGYDARGFLIGPPIALALKIPFVLLRKDGKNPGVTVTSTGYAKEYAEAKPDTQCIRLGSIGEKSRVVLVDDLIATGGTAIAGFELVEAVGAEVYEFAAMISLPFLDGVRKIRESCNGKFKDVSVFTVTHDANIPDAAKADPKVC